jgi:hypothetical protein
VILLHSPSFPAEQEVKPVYLFTLFFKQANNNNNNNNKILFLFNSMKEGPAKQSNQHHEANR